MLEESYHNLTLQQDKYLQEVQKMFVSIIGIGDALNFLNIYGSLVDQVMLLVKGVTRKDKYMASKLVTLSTMNVPLSIAQGDLENLCLDNASLAHKFNESSTASIAVVLKSIENSLQQLEHFHFSLYISREQVQSKHMLKDGKIVSHIPFFII